MVVANVIATVNTMHATINSVEVMPFLAKEYGARSVRTVGSIRIEFILQQMLDDICNDSKHGDGRQENDRCQDGIDSAHQKSFARFRISIFANL